MLDPRNVTQISGGLVDVPEIVNTGKAEIAKMRIGVDFASNDQNNRSGYFDVTMWRNDDQNSKFVFDQITQGNFKKGTPLIILGRLVHERWEQDGQNRSKVVIAAEAISYAGPRSQGESSPKSEGNNEPLPTKF